LSSSLAAQGAVRPGCQRCHQRDEDKDENRDIDLARQFSNETAFVVQRCTETGKGAVKTCTYADVATVAADVTTYKETPGSGTYRYRVRGSNAFGGSGYSNEVRK